MKLNFKQGVVSGFIITILTIGALGVYSYIGIERVIEGGIEQSHSLKIANDAERLLVTMIDLETGQRGFVITGDSAYLEPYDVALQSLGEGMSSLKAYGTTATRGQNLELLSGLVERKIAIAREILLLRAVSLEKANARMERGDEKKVMDSIRSVIDVIRGEVGKDYDAAREEAEKRLGVARYLVTVALGVPSLVLIVLFYKIFRNQEGLEKTNERLEKANQEIMKLNSDLESFTYSVSHDLRAPLRSINGYAAVLTEDHSDGLPDEAGRILGVIAKNGKRMGQLIDDLLDFSRLGRKELTKTEVSMDDLVRRVVEEMRNHPSAGNVWNIEIGSLPRVTADARMMEQVWVNLISNAVKYSSRHEKPMVEIGAYTTDDSTCFFVRDNGVGFNMQYVHKLFGVFQRLHKLDEFEGTGVGLALVKRIVDRHEGRVWAEGAINEGATFYFSIPK